MSGYKNIKGGKELDDFLSTLPEKMQRNIMRGALRTGAKPIADKARQLAPVANGDIRNSIRVSSKIRNGQVTATVKAGNKKAWYVHIIEFTGAVPHKIKAKSKGALSFLGFFGKSVEHPGMKAQPFMRPAMDSEANTAIAAVGAYIKKRLTKQGLNAPDIVIEDEE